MKTLTRTQLKWIVNLLKNAAHEALEVRDHPDASQTMAALANLEYENMQTTMQTVQEIIDSGAKRVTIK